MIRELRVFVQCLHAKESKPHQKLKDFGRWAILYSSLADQRESLLSAQPRWALIEDVKEVDHVGVDVSKLPCRV